MAGYMPVDLAREMADFDHREVKYRDDDKVQELVQWLKCFFLGEVIPLKNPSDFESIVLPNGSTANENAMYLARESTEKKGILTTNLSHNSITVAAQKLGMELYIVEVDPETLQVKPENLEETLSIHGDDIGVVVTTLGTTNFGTQENIHEHEIVKFLLERGTWLHADLAYGGVPLGLLDKFTEETVEVLERANSMTVDPYKFLGELSWSILAVSEKMMEGLELAHANYFDGSHSWAGTTMHARPLFSAKAVIDRIGLSGLRDIAKECYSRALYVENVLSEDGLQTITPVESTLVPIRLNDSEQAKQIMQELRYKHGIRVAKVDVQGTDYSINGIRIGIHPRPDSRWENIDKFVEAMRTTVATYR